MKISSNIKAIREAKGLSQKEVAVMLKMDASQYSKIENAKTDPTSSTLEKIAKALGVELSELFASSGTIKDVNSYDKTMLEKLRLIDQLEEKEKKSIFNIVDGLIAKKILKDSLSNALTLAK